MSEPEGSVGTEAPEASPEDRVGLSPEFVEMVEHALDDGHVYEAGKLVEDLHYSEVADLVEDLQRRSVSG